MDQIVRMQRVIMEMELAGHMRLASEMKKILAGVARAFFNTKGGI